MKEWLGKKLEEGQTLTEIVSRRGAHRLHFLQRLFRCQRRAGGCSRANRNRLTIVRAPALASFRTPLKSFVELPGISTLSHVRAKPIPANLKLVTTRCD